MPIIFRPPRCGAGSRHHIAWDGSTPLRGGAEQPDLLNRVHDSALIESFAPLHATGLDVLWDVAATPFQHQLYESYKHVFNRYLSAWVPPGNG
jgi:hypothetical protein